MRRSKEGANKIIFTGKESNNNKILSSIIKKVRCTGILLNTSRKQMINNSAPCFNEIYFDLIPSYTELH